MVATKQLVFNRSKKDVLFLSWNVITIAMGGGGAENPIRGRRQKMN